MATNIITAKLGCPDVTVWADFAWQYDYGQILRLDGVDLPDAYEVHLSNKETGGTTITQIGTPDGVTVPDEFFLSGENIYVFIFLHAGMDDGETVYKVVIPVKDRPQPSDEEPTPVQQSAIDQAIAALNVAVESADASAVTATEAAAAAAESAAQAATSAEGVEHYAQEAAASAEEAAGYVATVSEYASQAAASATAAASSAAGADQSADEADTSADAAAISATNAAASATAAFGSATTATQKATEAANSATAASGSATAASGSATQAAASATAASQSATAAAGSATEAASSATAASNSATTASTKADEAAASATSAAASAAEAAETAAEITAALLNKADVITDTASGSIVSIPDGMASPVLGLDVDIEPIQDLHGYDNPWPAGGGKNLIDMYGKVGTNFISKNMTLADGTYTLSATGINGNYATYIRTATTEGDVSGEIIASKANQGNFTFTLAESAEVVIQWYCPNDTATTLSGHTFQLEKGSSATSYAPYSNICPISGRSEVNVYVEESYDPQASPKATIQLGQTVYGGNVDVTSGKLVIDKAYAVLDTSRPWTKSSSYPGGYFTTRDFTAGMAKEFTPFICSHAKTVTTLSWYVKGTCYCDSRINFRLMDENSTLQDWLNYIESQANNGAPIQICYELATPVEVTLTAEELDILHGDNNIWADSGDTAVEYRADTKKYILKKIAEALNA